MDKLNQVYNFNRRYYLFVIIVLFLFFQILTSEKIFAQVTAPAPSVLPSSSPATTTKESTYVATPTAAPSDSNAKTEEDPTVSEDIKTPVQILEGATPNKKRIRRHLSLIKGIKVDEEILIPTVPLKILPLDQKLISIVRIKNSDVFRIEPQEAGNRIVTLHNRKTGQIYAELHLDVRDPVIDKTIRELKALLSDVEGLEFKVVNGGILVDGFVLLPQDLLRVGNVLATYAGEGYIGPKISSLVTLSPVARKRIIEYISREVNNPEVTVSTVGDYIKLEGSVNSEDEKKRIADLVAVYLPSYVTTANMGGNRNVVISERKLTGDASTFILNLITVRKQEDKEEPPTKMVQVVFHFVEFSERYLKSFSFGFEPILSTTSALQLNATQQAGGQNSIDSIASLVNNLLPKLSWARTHGFLRVLDTTSILVEENTKGHLDRNLKTAAGAGATSTTSSSNTTIDITPKITQPRAGLISLDINVTNTPGGGSIAPSTNIVTKITVRDRQSAAFGGVISKATNNDYGGEPKAGAILTLNAAKKYTKNSGNFVVFVTPIIKTSASAGVEQVKKKFRLKE